MKVYLGGTFDPVHNGHIYLARDLVSVLKVSELYLMPCYMAVHKNTVAASPKQRLEMLNIAVSAYPELIVDERELAQAVPSYTFDSLLSIKTDIGDEPLSFAMGIDSLLSFSDWYKADEISRLANLIVIDRPAGSFNVSDEALFDKRKESMDNLSKLGFSVIEDSSELKACQFGKAVVLSLDLHDISSTEIRNLSKERKNITHLVGTKVAEYIQAHNLYQS